MSYPGSKAGNGVWQRIIGQMPPHSVYLEAYFGSGAVFHNKRPAKSSVVIDRNPKCLESLTPLPSLRILLGKFLDLLPTIYLPDDAVVYCDPPYPLSTRQQRLYYDHELTDEEHAALILALKALKCRVLLSGMPCDLYLDALQDWRCVRYRTRWHTKTVTECLWCNFPEPELLHDWRFAGNNFRQRLALKRLANRTIAKLKRMSPRKQGYVLNAIRENYGIDP